MAVAEAEAEEEEGEDRPAAENSVMNIAASLSFVIHVFLMANEGREREESIRMEKGRWRDPSAGRSPDDYVEYLCFLLTLNK